MSGEKQKYKLMRLRKEAWKGRWGQDISLRAGTSKRPPPLRSETVWLHGQSHHKARVVLSKCGRRTRAFPTQSFSSSVELRVPQLRARNPEFPRSGAFSSRTLILI